MLGFSSTKLFLQPSSRNAKTSAKDAAKRLFRVHARLKGLKNDTSVVKHLKKHFQESRTIGLAYPTGQQLDNSGDLPKHSEKAYARVANMLQLIAPEV